MMILSSRKKGQLHVTPKLIPFAVIYDDVKEREGDASNLFAVV